MEFKRPKTAWRPPSELPELRDGEPIGFDFETTGNDPLKDDAISYSVWSPTRQQGWYLPWGHRGGGNLDEKMCKRWAKDNLANRDWFGLNGKFECHVARRWGLDFDVMNSRPHDVAFNAALLNENRYSGFSLEALAEEFLPDGERKIQPSTVDPARFYLASAGEVAERCISDSKLAWRIHEETLHKLKAEELTDVLELENKCILPVADMEWNGAPIDRPKLERWVKESAEKINTTFMKIYNGLGFPVNPDKFEDMRKLFIERGIKIPIALDEDPETHEVSERETFAAPYIKDIKDEYVQAALELRRTKSIKSKYLDKYAKAIDSSNILRYSLHQLRGDDYGTVTGRFSCGGGKHNVNIQQVMKCEKQIEDFGPDFIIRELFTSGAGDLFSTDASQIEFRLFGHYSGSERLIRAYNEDRDVDFHQIVTDMIRLFIEIARREAKHINFGKLYGMGLKKLCARLHISEEEGHKLLGYYDEAFPEAGRLLRKASNLAKSRGFVKTLLGRRRRYPDARRLHSALNAVIQGGAADVFKKKLLELFNARKQLEITLRMPVHDEFVGDSMNRSKRGQLQELLDTQSLPLKVPLIWSTAYGTDWRLGEGQ